MSIYAVSFSSLSHSVCTGLVFAFIQVNLKKRGNIYCRVHDSTKLGTQILHNAVHLS